MAIALMRDLFGFDTRKLLTEARVPVRCINSAGGYRAFAPALIDTYEQERLQVIRDVLAHTEGLTNMIASEKQFGL
jgi:hypothetical protein